MRKYFILIPLITMVLAAMAFAPKDAGKTPKAHPKPAPAKEVAKKPCSCGTPTITSAVRSGGFVHVTWTAVSGAVNYSLGGYRSSCMPATFVYCVSGTSYDVPSSCFITTRVTANCNGTSCTDATCSGSPSLPYQSN